MLHHPVHVPRFNLAATCEVIGFFYAFCSASIFSVLQRAGQGVHSDTLCLVLGFLVSISVFSYGHAYSKQLWIWLW